MIDNLLKFLTDTDIKCFYCGRPCDNFQALHAHLRFCQERKEYFNEFPYEKRVKKQISKLF